MFRTTTQPRQLVSRVIAVLFIGSSLSALARAGDDEQWSRFRGPNGAGVSSQAAPVRWKSGEEKWRVKLPGVGHASPVLWDDRIFLASGDEESGERILSCRHVADGRQLWSRRFPDERHRKHALNSFASSTPVADAERVYFCWGTPKQVTAVAFDHAGKQLWKVGLGEFKGGHGFGVSPIIYRDLLIVPNEQQGQSWLAALDSKTGKTRWKVERESNVNYATPCIYRRDGGDELVLTNWKMGLTGLSLSNGKELWRANIFDKGHTECAIGSPIVIGDKILGTCGYLGYGNEVVAVRPQDFVARTRDAEPAYRISRGAPLCTTPLAVNGLLFLWSDSGVVTCADADTGELLWRKRVGGTYYASPVAAGGHLYNVNTNGDVVVLAIDRKFRQVAKNSLGEASHSTPAIVGGVIYWRTFSHLIAVGG